MTDPDLKKNNELSDTSDNSIQSLLNEIKEFENRFPEYQINEPEFIEVDTSIIDDESENKIKSVDIEKNVAEELSKLSLKYKIKRLKLIKIKRKKTSSVMDKVKTVKKTKDSSPTVFNVGFNNEGKLVNLDLREIKKEPKSNRFGFLNKLNFKKNKKKGAKEQKGEIKESKIKSVFGKIGKLKKAIPHKGEKKSKKEEK